MDSGLFRKEVFEDRSRETLGSIELSPPRLGWIALALAGLLLTALAVLLVFGHYTRRERAEGELVPAGGLLTVDVVAGGVVSRLLVAEGETVTAGQPLAEISNESSSPVVGDARAAIIESLKAQEQRLRRDLVDQESLNASRTQEIAERAELIRKQLTLLSGQIESKRERTKVTQAFVEKVRPLVESGYLTEFQLDERVAAALNAKIELDAVLHQELETRQNLLALQDQLRQAPLAFELKRGETEHGLHDVEQAIARAEVERVTVLRAPAAGVASGLSATAGQSVAAGRTLLSIIPKDALLHAELRVPDRAIGFITEGDPVVLRYRAFPYERYGQQHGVVKTVSRVALPRAAGTASAASGQAGSYYRVVVDLDEQALVASGRRQALKPNMSFDADILLDRQRLLSWIISPT